MSEKPRSNPPPTPTPTKGIEKKGGYAPRRPVKVENLKPPSNKPAPGGKAPKDSK